MVRIRLSRLLVLASLVIPVRGSACSVSRVATPMELLSQADLVVRVKAVAYQRAPEDPKIWTSGPPDSTVRFQVLETLRGQARPTVLLHAYLVYEDDFNDQKSPYTFVRPGGRTGSCFANSYREGAEYLLFLKRERNAAALTVNWSALAPVNEQLHDENDPWLLWVREQAKQSPAPTTTRLLP